MLSTLKKFILSKAQSTPPSTPGAVPSSIPAPPPPRIELYPPNDGRLAIVRAHDVLKFHHADISAVAQAIGVSPDKVEARVVQPISRLVELVLNLPATRDEFYRGSGGLFRLSLDTALFAARKAHQTEFSGLTMIERRRQQAHRWCLATFLAGLCIDMHRVMTSYVVMGDGQEWAPLLHPLDTFVEQKKIQHVEIAWRGDGSGTRQNRAWNLSLLRHVVGNDIQQYLYDGDPDILRQFHAYISDDPSSANGNIIRDIVETVRTKLIARDVAVDPMRFGKKSLGTTLGPYFADGLRDLVTSGKWTVNDEKGRVWIGHDAVYLVWPVAAKEIIGWLSEVKLPGIPTDPHTLAELLRDAGIIVPYERGSDAVSLVWPITLPKGREVNALRMASSDVLWPAGDAPDAVKLVLRDASSSRTVVPTAPSTGATVPATIEITEIKPSTPSQSTFVQATKDLAIPPTLSAGQPSNLSAKTAQHNASALALALEQLDPLGKHLMKRLIESLKKPPSDAAHFFLIRRDQRIEITEAFLDQAGLDKKLMAQKLASAGWIEQRGGKNFMMSEQLTNKYVCTISAHICPLLLPAGSQGGLFSPQEDT